MIDSKFQVSSEAIFGSAARGDNDFLSDRDYLIVEDNSVLRRKRELHLKKQGWSVAAYSWSRLNSLKKKRGLFIQHLKLEAKILKDKGDRLKNELSSFQPKTSYKQERIETSKLLALGFTKLKTQTEIGWALDLFAVGVRNYAILTLAEHGHYTFNFEDVLNQYGKIKNLNKEQIQILKELRFEKAVYRHGFSTSLTSEKFKKIKDILEISFETGKQSTFEKRSPFSFLEKSNAYTNLRLVEKDLIRARPSKVFYEEEFNFLARAIKRKIIDPRTYSWEFSDKKKPLWNDLEHLKRYADFRTYNLVNNSQINRFVLPLKHIRFLQTDSRIL